MAKLPTLRRLFKNDFKPEYSELVDNITNPLSYPSSGVTISWDQITAGSIQIKHISGLTEGNTYNIRVVIYGDEN